MTGKILTILTLVLGGGAVAYSTFIQSPGPTLVVQPGIETSVSTPPIETDLEPGVARADQDIALGMAKFLETEQGQTLLNLSERKPATSDFTEAGSVFRVWDAYAYEMDLREIEQDLGQYFDASPESTALKSLLVMNKKNLLDEANGSNFSQAFFREFSQDKSAATEKIRATLANLPADLTAEKKFLIQLAGKLGDTSILLEEIFNSKNIPIDAPLAQKETLALAFVTYLHSHASEADKDAATERMNATHPGLLTQISNSHHKERR